MESGVIVPDSDLQHAFRFVVERIEAQATRSGEPLTDDERFLLNDLPTEPIFPTVSPVMDPESFPPVPVPRDFVYERLIALAKQARRNDLRTNPGSELDWAFAFAVSKLSRHPMSWLLSWAGMKESRPWWDRPVLIGAALLFISVSLLLTYPVIGSGARIRWAVSGIAYLSVLFVFYLASRHLEERQWKQTIEKCRRNRNFMGPQKQI